MKISRLENWVKEYKISKNENKRKYAFVAGTRGQINRKRRLRVYVGRCVSMFLDGGKLCCRMITLE